MIFQKGTFYNTFISHRFANYMKRNSDEIAMMNNAEQAASLMAYSSSSAGFSSHNELDDELVDGEKGKLANKSDFSDGVSEGDVRAQLAQKEKDLILAAELGKALLEKNEELSQQNERIAEEYSQRLEVGTSFFLLEH